MRNKLQLSLFLILLIIGVQGKFTNIIAQPTVDFTYSGVCVGSPTVFTVNAAVTNVSVVTTWLWDFGDGNFSNSPITTSHTYLGVGSYPVTLTITDTSGISGSITYMVDIRQLPVANFAYTPPNCSNDTLVFADLSHSPDGYITRWIWNYGDGSPSDTVFFPDDPTGKHVFLNTGSYFVTLSVLSSYSCVGTVSKLVTITPGPVANFHFTGQCEEQSVAFTDASTAGGPGSIVAWEWNFGDPTSGVDNFAYFDNPTHVFDSPGTYTVLLKVTNFSNCSDTISKQVIIHTKPDVGFIYTPACLNDLTIFNQDTAIVNEGAIQTWEWDFGDGNTGFGPTMGHVFIGTGTYNVTLKITDTLGCENEITKQVIIYALPVAHFSAGSTNCAGSTVNFMDLSGSPHGFIVRWEWDFGDGNSQVIVFPASGPVVHTYALPGTYPVTLVVTSSDSCSGTELQNVIIHPNPVASFYFSDPTCAGSAVTFTDNSQPNGGGSILQWQWNFGDPGSGISNFATTPTAPHTFTGTGVFTVQLVVTTANGCTDTLTRQITIKPLPPVDFTSTHNCQNNAVIFDPDLAVMNLVTIKTWFWDFGDGITSPLSNPTHVYSTPGPKTVTLTVTDTSDCVNSISKVILIVPEPTANFSHSTPTCKDTEVQFNNLSDPNMGYIVQCEWDFGDGNTQTVTNIGPVFHTYTSYAIFPVTLTVTTNDSCKNSKTINIDVLPNPLANFSYATTCVNTAVVFDDLSQAGSGSIESRLWNFGDPPSGSNNTSNLENPSHIYNTPGTYNVTLTVSNTGGCEHSIMKTITVHPLPVVDFTSAPGCVNDSTHFISSTFVNTAATDSWLWNFGDGFTANDIEDPYHTYTASGTHQVILTITDTSGCVNTISHFVTITPPPTSFFQVSTQTCTNAPVLFTNLSTASGGTFTSYYYDFGDGTDTLIMAPATGNVEHTYAIPGTYNVVLTVNTSMGCEDDFPRTIVISSSPLALFDYDNTCAGASVVFTDMSQVNSGTTITNWSWIFGDPLSGTSNISNEQNPQHIYTNPGTYTVVLEVGNATGCTNTISKDIVIHPKPTVDFDWTSTCIGTITSFTTDTVVTVTGAVVSYDWDFGDGSPHTSQQNTVHIYTVPGDFNVILTIVDTAGCSNQKTQVVSITPQPVALFSMSSGCLGARTFFTDESFTLNGEPIAEWDWDFGITTASNDTSDLQNPTWIYSTLGVYNVTLIVTSQSGCQDTITQTLQVFSNPTANFNFTASPCDNGTVYFQDSSYNQQSAIVGWNWELEPNHYSTLQNPVYVYYASDSCYTVRLIVTDVRGCVDTTYRDDVCVPAEFDFSFSASPTCLLDSTYFTPLLVNPLNDSLIFFNWNFGDPTSGIYNTSAKKIPSHYYAVPGKYSVSLEATDINNCTKTIHLYVDVFPLPLPVFSYTEGYCDSTIFFKEASSGNGSNIDYWLWDYGDGITDTIFAPDDPDLPHKYASAGLYVVSLSVTNTNGCTTLLADSNVLVKPCIEASFALIDTMICQNNTLSFDDNSTSGLPVTQWYWNFGDGTDTTYHAVANPVQHIFRSSGTFTVKLVISTVVSGKTVSDSTDLVVVVSPTPLPDFNFGVVCHEQQAVFTNMSSSGNGPKISNYSWEFGEPISSPNDTSTFRNASHLYKAPGTYSIKLVVENTIGCRDSIQKTLVVLGLPDANYSYNLSCAGDKTTFSDLSIEALAPIVTWDWAFTDNSGVLGRMDVQNPEFVFTAPGEYLVNLMVTDTNGCYDTVNQHVTTWDVPTSIYSYTDNFNDVQGQLQFINSSIDATKYYWTFGNGDDSYSENPVAFYNNDGTYDITLVTWNEKECSDTLTVEYKFMVKGLYIPNAFSPANPKKEVQLLKPVGINLKQYRFEVYDRWGNMLWWTDKLDAAGRPTEGWDGRYNGVLMQEGAYVWKASGIFRDGTIWEADNMGNNDNLPKVKSGTATMLR